MAEDIDNDILISLVQANPVLWDKTLDEYKDKTVTAETWKFVCCQLKEDFDEMDSRDKTEFGRAVTRRWINLRDAFYRSMRKMKGSTKGGRKLKKYVYNDQMQFLNKLYQCRETARLLDDGFDNDKHKDKDHKLLVSEQQGSLEANRGYTQKSTGSRKRSLPDDVEMPSVLDTSTPNSHMCFFQGILPHLNKFDENEMLEFQMGVLQVISAINENRRVAQTL